MLESPTNGVKRQCKLYISRYCINRITKQVGRLRRVHGVVAEGIVLIFGNVLTDTRTRFSSNVGASLFSLSKLPVIK